MDGSFERHGMRRAIVHIGTPRTGTTSLQRILFSRRDQLQSAGILYPDLTPASAAEPHLSHQHLGEALAGRRPARDRRELLERLDTLLRATACDTLILSYEALCLIPPSFGAPGTLGSLFARHGVTMETVMTVKPQVEYLNSSYTWRMQFLRESRMFPDFLRAELGARAFDYGRLLAPWREASRGRATIVPVRDAGDERPLVARVFAAFGLEERVSGALERADLGLVENRSPGPLAIEICRRLRASGAAPPPGTAARDVTRAVEREARARGDGAAFIGYDEDSRARLEARWREANERFAETAWATGWAARVASAPRREMNEIARRPVAAATESMIGEIMDICRRDFGITTRGRTMARLREAGERPAAALRHLHRRLRLAIPR
jgi:hypothetical protein